MRRWDLGIIQHEWRPFAIDSDEGQSEIDHNCLFCFCPTIKRSRTKWLNRAEKRGHAEGGERRESEVMERGMVLAQKRGIQRQRNGEEESKKGTQKGGRKINESR